MSATDHAQALLQMAVKDLKALRGMSDPNTFDDEIFGFHAQQAVEKSLKAWIAMCGGTFPPTHDIRLLLLNLSKLNMEIAEFKDLVKLNVFAVQFRYESALGLSGTVDRRGLLNQVERLFKYVRTEIPADHSPI